MAKRPLGGATCSAATVLFLKSARVVLLWILRRVLREATGLRPLASSQVGGSFASFPPVLVKFELSADGGPAGSTVLCRAPRPWAASPCPENCQDPTPPFLGRLRATCWRRGALHVGPTLAALAGMRNCELCFK